MKKIVFLFLGIALYSSIGWTLSSEDLGWLPPAHELFTPLRADPRQLQYSLRAVIPVSHTPKGDVALGDYLGMYRWTLPGGKGVAQWSVGGGVFGRFELDSKSNSLQVSDYYGNTPIDLRYQKWSGRVMLYHTSSHLGDDYLSKHNVSAEKHSWDNLLLMSSYDANAFVRLYGGYTYVCRTLPSDGRNALQTGLEINSRWVGHKQFYWANDFQSWQRTSWNPMFNSQAGIKFVKDPAVGRGISLFMEYGAGMMPYGQFYLQKESHWNFGIKFHVT